MGSLPPSVHVNSRIVLTDKENQIFDLLLQVCRHFNLNTVLRVAGGWVRDKLLGKECYDIDIALDNMVGKEFCDKVNEYLSATGEETKGIGLIQSNPDQSKHLDTARMHLFDVWIDFVNLRSEEYTNNSRIPTMIDQMRLSLYAAPLLPFRKTVYRDKKGKQVLVARYIFGTSLKLKSSDAETVISLHLVVEKFLSLIPFILSSKDLQILEVEWKKEIIDVPVMAKLRVLAGLLLREIKEFWRSALVLSILLYPTDIGLTGNSSSVVAELTDRRELFNRVENAIMELGLEKVWELKPLVNGKDIMSILQLKSGGPVVKKWQQKLLEWQLAHPSGSSEECIDWMKQSQSKRPRME